MRLSRYDEKKITGGITMAFEGSVAVITGAAGCIGGAIARRFWQEGARVALLDINDTALSRAASAISPGDERLLPLKCDVQSPIDVERAFGTIDRIWGATEIVIANAGVAQAAPFIHMDLNNWNHTLAVNLTGVFLVCQAGARRMITQHKGVIITMSSTNGIKGERGLAAYNASKAGVSLLTKTMAIELAPFGIRANALNPGFIDTGLATRSGMDADFVASYSEKIPLARWGQPEEVAAAAVFLASDHASFITGIDLIVDGGQLAQE